MIILTTSCYGELKLSPRGGDVSQMLHLQEPDKCSSKMGKLTLKYLAAVVPLGHGYRLLDYYPRL